MGRTPLATSSLLLQAQSATSNEHRQQGSHHWSGTRQPDVCVEPVPKGRSRVRYRTDTLTLDSFWKPGCYHISEQIWLPSLVHSYFSDKLCFDDRFVKFNNSTLKEMLQRGELGGPFNPSSVFKTRGWACDGYLRMVRDLKKKK